MANEFLTYDLLRQQEMARLNRFTLPQPSNTGALPAPVGNELSLALAGPQLKTQEDYLNYLKNAGKVNTNDAGYKAALKQAQKSGETVKYLGADGRTYAVNPEGKAHFVSHSDATQHVSPKEKSPIVRNTSDVTTPVETTPAGTDKKVVDKKVVDKKARKARLSKNRKKYQEAKKATPAPATTTPVETPQVAGEKLPNYVERVDVQQQRAKNEEVKQKLLKRQKDLNGTEDNGFKKMEREAKTAIEQNKVNAQADELEKLRKENEKLKADSKNRREKMAQWRKDRQAMKKPADKFQEFSGKKLDTDYAKVADVDPVIHAEKQARYDKLFGKTDVAKKGKKLGKWGKLGIIAAAVGLVVWGISKLAKKDDAVAEETPVVTTPPATEEDTTTVVTTPPAEETPVVTTPPTEETPEEETTTKEYTVKKGDNIWNIAKAQLEVELGRTPTLREIKNRETTIMKNNPELKWEDDNYRVIIQPGQVINIAA